MLMLLNSFTLVGLRTGEYVFGHFSGNRDGAITAPFLVISLPIIYGTLLTILTILIIFWLYSRLHLQNSVVLVICLALLLTTVWLYQCWIARTQYLLVSVQSSISGIAQLFYDIGNGIHEEDSVIVEVVGGETFVTIQFPLPQRPIHVLRLDPLDRVGLVAVKDINIVDLHGKIWKTFKPKAFQPLSQIKWIENKEGVLWIETAGNDPQLLLSVSYPLPLGPDRTSAIFYGFGVFGGSTILLSIAFWRLRHDVRIRNILTPLTRSIAQTILIGGICFVVGEMTIRIYNYFNPVFIFYTDSYNRFRGKPFGTDWEGFTLNSQGFKDLEFTEKQADHYRILGIGDSFAFGVVPYKNNYLTLLEFQLNQQGFKVEVLNMGIPCIGPKEYLALLLREGLKLKPDMVMVSFFIGNDFITEAVTEKRPLYSYSYFVSLIHYLVHIQPQFQGGSLYGAGEYCDTCSNFTHDAYLQLEYTRSFIYAKKEKRFQQYFDDTCSYLSQIRDVCQKNDIALVVVIIPDEVQINLALQAEVKNTYFSHLSNEDWNITLPNELLTNKLDSLGIEYLDLYPSFAREATHQSLYRPRDSHWNIAGNQLAANGIQAHLAQYIENQGETEKIERRP